MAPMSKPLVSILIPCYNAESYIGESIASALSQTYSATEVIVYDDGSTDDSLAVVERIAKRDGIQVDHGPNRGGNATRNILLKMAQGEYIQFLDADDVLLPEKIASQVSAMQPGSDVVLSDYYSFGGQLPRRENRIAHTLMHEDTLAYFLQHAVITMLPLHRREHLMSVGGFDESLPCCQEYELHVRLAMSVWQRVAYIPEVLSGHRRVSGSVSSNDARVFSVQLRFLRKWHEELLEASRLNPVRARAIAVSAYSCGRHLAKHGKREEAEIAFELAAEIDANAEFDTRWPMRAISRVVGPYRAERIRKVLFRRD